MAEHLAHLQWRMQRAERIRESLLVQRIEQVEARRRDKVLPLRQQYVDRVDFLAVVQSEALRPDFYAPPGYFREFRESFEGGMTSGGKAILGLLQRLRKPPNLAPATGALPEGAPDDQDWQERLATLEAEPFPIPRSKLPVAEGEEREALREELRERARVEESLLAAAWEPEWPESDRSLTTTERDCAAAAAAGPQMKLMRRDESSCFREFWRLGNILMKIQDRGEGEQSGVQGPKFGVGNSDFGVGISESGDPSAESEGQDLEFKGQDSGSAGGMAADVGPNGVRPSAPAELNHKNEGAPGDVYENKGNGNGVEMTDCAVTSVDDRQKVTPPTTDLPYVEGSPGGVVREAASGAKF
jgi:hypothetical protein